VVNFSSESLEGFTVIKNRIKKFLIIGSSAAFVNLILMFLFVEVLGFQTYFFKNLANILSIEISAVYNFTISRLWTWADAPKRQGKYLVIQFFAFNLAGFTGLSMRAIAFASLELLGVYYLLNVTIGIGLAATVDFILYDKFVFRRAGNRKQYL